MRPAAAVATHRAGEQQQRQHRAVGGVAVEPLADTGTHDDHRPAAGLLGVARELLCDPDRLCGRDSGDRLLPGGRVRRVGVVVPGGPIARQAGTGHSILGQHQVEDGAHQVFADPAHRHTARQYPAMPVDRVEARKMDQCGLAFGTVRGRGRQGRNHIPEVQVPLADAVVAVAESERAVRHGGRVAGPVEQYRLERRVLHVVPEIGCGEVLAGHQRAAALLELDQERQVGVIAGHSRRRTESVCAQSIPRG